MLKSISITNYRSLKNLTLESLGRVNLITGKNNTGKSSLLEAIGILGTKGSVYFLAECLKKRNEDFGSSEENVRTFLSLFTKEVNSSSLESVFIVGEDYLGKRKVIEFKIKISEMALKNLLGESGLRKRINELHGASFEIFNDDDMERLDLGYSYDHLNRASAFDYKGIQYVDAKVVEQKMNAQLFNQITLTEKEDYVIEALKIIQPDVERIAFTPKYNSEISVFVKLSNSRAVQPLSSMGDGVSRILNIILALVNCENGYLLIDEFENGLHHSVQVKLWEIICKLSEALNIQVFATTHSEDCIASFQKVLNSTYAGKEVGKMIRLENKNGVIKPVEYSAAELKIATENHIETR